MRPIKDKFRYREWKRERENADIDEAVRHRAEREIEAKEQKMVK